jgi:PRTRC genetic system protein E
MMSGWLSLTLTSTSGMIQSKTMSHFKEDHMFRELAPFLRNRSVLLTVTDLGEDLIRVNVVPKKLKDGENVALTTPLSVTGTADELDAELSSTLVGYVGAHLQLKNSLESAKSQMDAAAKAVQEEARSKVKNTSKGSKPQTAALGDAETEELIKPAEYKPSTNANRSLFDLPEQSTASTAPSFSSSIATQATAGRDFEEDEILADISEGDSSGEDLEDAA